MTTRRRFCRLCLCKSEVLLDIFQEDQSRQTVAELIVDLLQFKVTEGDGYSTFVCLRCYDKLSEFRKFKGQCVESKETFEKDFLTLNCFHALDNPCSGEVEGITHMGPLKVESVDVDDPQGVPSAVSGLEDIKHELPGTEERDCQSALSSVPLKVELIDFHDGPSDVGEVEDVEHQFPNTEEERECQFAISNDPLKEELVEGNTTHGTLSALRGGENIDSQLSEAVEGQWQSTTTETQEDPLKEEFGDYSVSCETLPSFREREYVVSQSPEGNARECKSESPEVKVRKNRGVRKKARLKNAMDFSPKDKAVKKTSQLVGSERNSERNGIITNSLFLKSSRPVKKVTARVESNNGKSVEPTVFVCDYCGHKYCDKLHLSIHMWNQTCKTALKSDECRKQLNNNASLRSHAVVHDFKCGTCGKVYADKRNLNHHIFSHTKQWPFKCDICKKGFSRKDVLRIHCRAHAGAKPFKCEVCQKGFSQTDHLNQHLLSHTGIKKFKCGVCEKGFSKKYNFNRHLLVHTGIKLFHCEVCQKGFSRKPDLRQHLVTHSHVKPFQCELCGKRYTRKQYLTNHTCKSI